MSVERESVASKGKIDLWRPQVPAGRKKGTRDETTSQRMGCMCGGWFSGRAENRDLKMRIPDGDSPVVRYRRDPERRVLNESGSTP